MIHEIFPHQFNNQFVAAHNLKEDDLVFLYNGNDLLLKTDGDKFEIPKKRDIPEISETTEKTFLFTFNDIACFIIWDCPQPDDNKFVYKDISFFRTINQQEIAWISIVGFQLMNWYSQNRFCGKCGSKTEEKTDERAIICNNCNTVVYPKISPAIIVAITCNDKILLAHNANFPGSWYSLVAGYADVGESLEETVTREVKEEVGVEVKNIRYYKSQPWPFSGTMMIGFFAEADCSKPVYPDNKEITDAAWYERGKLPSHPPAISIAGEMIEIFEKGGI